MNRTADHTLLPWYHGTDEKLVKAVDITSQGGWRNQVTSLQGWMLHDNVRYVVRSFFGVEPSPEMMVHTSAASCMLHAFDILPPTAYTDGQLGFWRQWVGHESDLERDSGNASLPPL